MYFKDHWPLLAGSPRSRFQPELYFQLFQLRSCLRPQRTFVFVIFGELREEPGQNSAIGIFLGLGGSLYDLKVFQKFGVVHGNKPSHVDVSQIAVGALIGVPLDGLSHHLGLGKSSR